MACELLKAKSRVRVRTLTQTQKAEYEYGPEDKGKKPITITITITITSAIPRLSRKFLRPERPAHISPGRSALCAALGLR